jgi:hypothetical protein
MVSFLQVNQNYLRGLFKMVSAYLHSTKALFSQSDKALEMGMETSSQHMQRCYNVCYMLEELAFFGIGETIR